MGPSPCRNCGVELPPQAAFCPKCGTPVATDDQAAAEDGLRRFVPPELLSKLEHAAAQGGMQGERRTVTMLFCDVQGSTAAAETMDPEEWAEVMNGAFEHLIAPVYKYEGTLARLMGDAILAFFGAPIAHEDDAERAVLAGLEIIDTFDAFSEHAQTTWGIDVAVRVGINTGLVVVGAVGSDLRVEYTAMGDAVNTAARMESTAQPGTVQVAGPTHALVERLFAFEELGGVEVKGKAEPVTSYRVVDAVPRPETTRGIEGLSSPLVGRDQDLAALLDALQVTASGAGGIVSVVADAGLGKSRLTTEGRRSFLEAHPDAAWHEGRSLSFETGTPYAPVRRLLLSMMRLEGGESPAESWRRIEQTVETATPGRSAEIAPFLADVLDVSVPEEHAHRLSYLEPQERQKEAFRAFVDVVSAIASADPLVLVFEDLHWADPASLELVEHLLPLTDRHALVLVFLFRPRREEGSWRVHEIAGRDFPHRYTVLELSPLSEDESRQLVANLLAIDGLSDAVRELILSRSEGNPFFVEEIIRSMIDRGMVEYDGSRWVATGVSDAMEVPQSVSAVLTTRLDALDEGARQIAQAAAVIGRQFRYDELAACLPSAEGLDSGLLDLQRRELVREVARIPKRLYRFRHALVQEAAYETVLRKQRSRYHAAIAEFIERTQPERVEDLAYHFFHSGLGERALPHLVEAGERSAASYAVGSAADHLERALSLLGPETDDTLVRRALEALGGVRQFVFDMEGALEMYRRLEAEGEERDNQGMVVSALNKMGLIRAAFFDERDEGLEDLRRSEELARSLDIGDGLVEACIHQCMVRTSFADFVQVEHYMSELQRIGEEMGQTEPTLFGMTHLANTFTFLTRWEEAIEAAEKALARAEELGNARYQAELLSFSLPFSHQALGNAETASAAAERAIEIAQQIGERGSEGVAAMFQAQVAMERGYLEDALALSRRAAAALDRTGVPYMRALGQCVTGTCYRSIGGPLLETAQEYHARTLEMVAMPTGSVLGTMVWAQVGHCALEAGEIDHAASMFQLALEEQNAAMYLSRPEALVGAAEIALVQGDEARARHLIDEAHEYVTDRTMNDRLPYVLITAARVSEVEGDTGAALEALGAAEEITAKQGTRRTLLDAQAARRRILAAMGDTDGAGAAAAAVRETADSIASDIGDDELRTAFEANVASLLAG